MIRRTVLFSFIVCLTALVAQAQKPDDLVDVRSIDSTIRIDIRYATANNFTHQVLYPVAKAKLRRAAAESLSAVQKDLRRSGLALKIYDAYRPLSIQKKLWEIVPNEDFVANPAKGSRHNRGAAVDLTIVIDSTGAELDMPTEYDTFSPRAAQDYMDLPDLQRTNRELLKAAMMRHGFLPLRSEWWHFDFKGAYQYELMDEPLE
ncbi:MAG: M15 family metallopeptidase [Acidobacteriota bacterium]